jgi:hypothetical protein
MVNSPPSKTSCSRDCGFITFRLRIATSLFFVLSIFHFTVTTPIRWPSCHSLVQTNNCTTFFQNRPATVPLALIVIPSSRIRVVHDVHNPTSFKHPITHLLSTCPFSDTQHASLFDSDRRFGCFRTTSHCSKMWRRLTLPKRFTLLFTYVH